MQYLGGKGRLAKKFAPVLRDKLLLGGRFIEPFVGGFNVVPHLGVSCRALCNDLHPGLATLYRALQSGWVPPEELSERDYQCLRLMEDWDDPLTAFAAFGCSFGGKEWGGYARGRAADGSWRSYADEAKRNLLRKVRFMDRVEFVCGDYRALPVTTLDVVYADPPYANTTGYKTGGFDHEVFFEWCEECAARGARVFVSEFTIPERLGWLEVWSLRRKETVSRKSQTRERTDYLVEVRA